MLLPGRRRGQQEAEGKRDGTVTICPAKSSIQLPSPLPNPPNYKHTNTQTHHKTNLQSEGVDVGGVGGEERRHNPRHGPLARDVKRSHALLAVRQIDINSGNRNQEMDRRQALKRNERSRGDAKGLASKLSYW